MDPRADLSLAQSDHQAPDTRDKVAYVADAKDGAHEVEPRVVDGDLRLPALE